MDRMFPGPRSYDCNIEIKQEDILEWKYMQRTNSNNTADSACIIDTNSELSGQTNFTGMEYDNNSPTWAGNSQDDYRAKQKDMDYEYEDISSTWNYGSQDGSMASPISPYGDSASMTSTWMNSSQSMTYSQPQHQHSHHHQSRHQQACSPTQDWSPSDYNNIGISNQGGLSPTSDNQTRKFVCLVAGCASKPFGRSADLDRHMKQIHAKEDSRDKFFCDYSRCQRKDGAFGRKDHFRDHFRDYHKEDIPQRGRSASKGWSEERYVNLDWWRCSKCLQRMTVAEVGYECRDCRFLCEPERKRMRERLRETNASKSGQR